MDNSLIRPSIAYTKLFDLLGSLAYPYRGTLAIKPSGIFYLTEIGRRLQLNEKLYVLGPEKWDIEELGPEIEPDDIEIVEQASGPVGALIWAEPETTDLNNYDFLLQADFAFVVTSNWLRFQLAEYQGGKSLPSQNPLGISKTIKLLRCNSYIIRHVFSIFGIQSLIYGFRSRIYGTVGLYQLQDRVLAGMRYKMVRGAIIKSFPPISLIVAQRKPIGV